MARRLAGILPILGVVAFVGLYFCAAWAYSAGNTIDPAHNGYDHLHNFWCELYNELTHSGERNLGRPWALVSAPILTGTAFFFWFAITSQFREFRRLCRVVWLTGPAAMLAAAFISTPAHDVVITVAVPLGIAALVATCVGLARKRRWLLVALAVLATAMSSLDYGLWKMELLKPAQAVIQKLAIALVLSWILISSLTVISEVTRRPRGLKSDISLDEYKL